MCGGQIEIESSPTGTFVENSWNFFENLPTAVPFTKASPMRQVLTTVLATQFWSFIARTLIRPDFSSWTVSELNGVPISDAHPVITIAVKNEKNNELELVIFSSAGGDALTFQ